MAKSSMLPILLLGGVAVAMFALGGKKKRGGGGASASQGPRPNVSIVTGLPTDAQARSWAPAVFVGAQRAAPLQDIVAVADKYPDVKFYVMQNVSPSEGNEIMGQTIFDDGTYDIWNYRPSRLEREASRIAGSQAATPGDGGTPGDSPGTWGPVAHGNYEYVGDMQGIPTQEQLVQKIDSGFGVLLLRSDTPSETAVVAREVADAHPDVFIYQGDCIPNAPCNVFALTAVRNNTPIFETFEGVDKSTMLQAIELLYNT